MGLVLASAAAYAAPVAACANPGGTTVLFTNLNADGYSCGDKLFTSFSGTSVPTGSITIQQISTDLYKVTFVPDGGSTTSAFTLNFIASVAAPSTDIISSVSTQILTSAVTGGLYPNTVTATSSGTGSSSISNTVMTGTGTGDDQNNLISYFPGVTSTTISFSVTPGANGRLQSYEVNVFESSAIPEPASLALMGSGLLGLAVMARRRNAKK